MIFYLWVFFTISLIACGLFLCFYAVYFVLFENKIIDKIMNSLEDR